MALVVADRIKETTSTTGTGTYTLAGATTGFEAFSVIGNGNTTYYCCTDSTDFEVGIGTYTSSGTTLARTTILQSSNSDNAVNWSSGTRDIFVTQPAEKAVFKDASGHIQAVDGRNLTNLSAGNLTGTVANARLDQQLQDVAGLAVTNGNFIVGDGSNFVAESGSTARTSLGLGTASVLDTGISNTNIPKFTSGVADNDFLRVDGTAIEGRSASEVLSDIGGQASLTFGISNTNAVKIDSSSVADDEYARFTASGLESRSTSEVLSDIGGISASSTSTLTNKTLTTPVINGFSGTGDGSIIGDLTLKSTDDGSTVEPNLKLVRDSASPADSDFLGQVTFLGDNSAGEQITYAKLFSKIIDVTDGTEDGNFTFNVMSGGSSLTVLNFKGNGSTTFSSKDVLLGTGVDLRFEGSSANAHETTITPTNPTQDNTLTLPNVSGTFITTGNSDSPSTTTSSSDADFVLIDDGGTMKKITPANLGIPSDIDYGLITSSASSTEDYGAIT